VHTQFISEKIEYHVYQDLLTPHAKKSYMPWRNHVPQAGEIE
jgi:hypothetical protein